MNQDIPPQEENLSTKATQEDFANGIKDEYGVIYSKDGKRLLKSTNNDLETYKIKEGCKVICGEAFRNHKELWAIKIPNSVTKIGWCAFGGCTGLTSISIGNSVTKIGDGAFGDCTGLTSVTIPNSVTEIGSSAFSGCTSLTNITIPNSVTEISSSAFSGCTGLTSINIPNSVTEIGKDAFGDCTGLTSVTIPNSVTEIGSFTFYGCTGLTSITIPNSVTEISWCAVEGCTGLTNITIPDSVTYIGESAFKDCTGLTSITIGNSVTEIDKNAFEGCTGLTTLNYNAVSCEGDGFCYYHHDYGGLYYCSWLECENLEIVNIGDGVKVIPNYFIKGKNKVKEIIIPSSVTEIGEDAFSGCTGLKSIRADKENKNYLSIDGVLFNKTQDELICYPAGKEDKEFIIPDSVTEIGDFAFANCTELTSINIPKGVTNIGDCAFKGCTGLEILNYNAVYCYGSFNRNKHWLKGCDNLRKVNIGNDVELIPINFICNKTEVVSINIPNSVTEIGSNAFEGCTGLTSIDIPDSVEYIARGAFYNVNLNKETKKYLIGRFSSKIFSKENDAYYESDYQNYKRNCQDYDYYDCQDYDHYSMEDSYMDAFDGDPDAYWNID